MELMIQFKFLLKEPIKDDEAQYSPKDKVSGT